MRFTEEMILSPDLWAGLHDPNRRLKETDVAVFGIPYDGAASFREGTKDGPRSIRDISFSITPTTEDFTLFDDLRVLDLGDFYGADQVDLFELVEKQVEELVREKVFFTMLGGDHSVTIPVLRGIDKAIQGSLGVIHIDAHLDLCDELDGNPLSHACPARRGTELKSINGSDGFYFLGIRSIERDEINFMKENKVHVISAREFSLLGVEKVLSRVIEHFKDRDHIYLTLDIDALDPAYASGTGTPQFGGLSSREILEVLRGLFRELPIMGFDVVEVAPGLSSSLTSSFAARKIITEMWGFHYRKNIKNESF